MWETGLDLFSIMPLTLFMSIWNKSCVNCWIIQRSAQLKFCFYVQSNSIFLVEFSVNIGRNSYLTSIGSQKIYVSLSFWVPFVDIWGPILWSRRTRKADQKYPKSRTRKVKETWKNSCHTETRCRNYQT